MEQTNTKKVFPKKTATAQHKSVTWFLPWDDLFRQIESKAGWWEDLMKIQICCCVKVSSTSGVQRQVTLDGHRCMDFFCDDFVFFSLDRNGRNRKEEFLRFGLLTIEISCWNKLENEYHCWEPGTLPSPLSCARSWLFCDQTSSIDGEEMKLLRYFYPAMKMLENWNVQSTFRWPPTLWANRAWIVHTKLVREVGRRRALRNISIYRFWLNI